MRGKRSLNHRPRKTKVGKVSTRMNAKTALRQYIRHTLAQASTEQKTAWSAALVQRLTCHPRFMAAKTVLLYHALPDEPSLAEVLTLWHKRKTLLLPKVIGEALTLHPYTGSESMAAGAFGIEEPTTTEWTALEQIDLIIVPARAYDKQGHRLGRGRGYYDRFLSLPDVRHAYTSGLAFPPQMVDAVPTEPHDQPLDEILTLNASL